MYKVLKEYTHTTFQTILNILYYNLAMERDLKILELIIRHEKANPGEPFKDTDLNLARLEARKSLDNFVKSGILIRAGTHRNQTYQVSNIKQLLRYKNFREENNGIDFNLTPPQAESRGASLNTKFWINKESGKYRYDMTLVHIKNSEANYAKIFDAAFSLKPQGGEITYNEIKGECSRRGLRVDSKKIQRALTGNNANFFRYVKSIKQAPIHGVNLFEASQNGKFITFNNKK